MLDWTKSSGEASRATAAGDASPVALLGAMVVAGLGASVLAGWAAGIESLKRLDAGLVAMNPLTACLLVAAGASIWFHHRQRRWAGLALGLLVALAAAAKIADLLFAPVPVDRLLFAGQLDDPAGPQPNRMAPNTAASLLLIGISLALTAFRSGAARVAGQWLALSNMLVATFALVGHLFSIDPLVAVGPFIPMALHTAVGLLAAGIGIVALGRDTKLSRVMRDRGPAGSMARLMLPFAISTPIAIGAARLWGEKLGIYGLEEGAALAALADAFVTSTLVIVSIFALYRSDSVRKEREEALARSEHFNRTINAASPDCISLLDADGNVLFSNDATLRAYGLADSSAVVGRRWGHRLDENARADVDAALEAAREGRIGRLTVSLPGPDGGLRWYESLVTKLGDEQSQPVAFIVMSRDITRQKTVEDQVRWAATHDSLTRLPNRALFQARLDQICSAGGRRQSALLVLDVDHFKQVNDTLGHDAGDALLSTVAARLRASVRKQDFVARLGGDEFAIILSDIRCEKSLNAVAGKVVRTLREPWIYNGSMSDCRVSIGACIASQPVEDSSDLLKKADLALYAAKLRGGGGIAVYEPWMGAETRKRASEISLARDALQHDMVLPTYQPKVELATGKLDGFEALLRWRHPTRGIQAPGLIGAAFEDLELAGALTDRMLACLLRDMRGWLDDGVEFGHVAVNAAAADFKQQDFAERLLERLERAGIPPGRLQVEVTETVFLGRGAEHVEKALRQLSASGIRIALDDFGTGYASLTHLKQFPVDVVKIDRSFLRDISEPHNAAIIRTVVSLGQGLGLDVVAEGVETPEQEAYLLAEGCRLGQGYLYGKAVPASRVAELVRSGPERARMAA